jgi:hypothetical protein
MFSLTGSERLSRCLDPSKIKHLALTSIEDILGAHPIPSAIRRYNVKWINWAEVLPNLQSLNFVRGRGEFVPNETTTGHGRGTSN